MSAKLNEQSTNAAMEQPRVFLVEDDPAMHMLLTTLIGRSEEVELELGVTTAGEAISHVPQSTADLILLDWHLPDGTGEHLLPEILAIRPQMKVLFMSTLFEADRVTQALKDGAWGFIDKWRFEEDLFAGIQTVIDGERFVSPPLDRLLALHSESGNQASGSQSSI
ncbi:MAG: response regulator [Limisphaerales bacterium]